MEITVAKICEVTFSHNYYTDEVINNLFVQPTLICRKLLSNYNIFYRRTTNGFVLLTRLEDTDSSKPFISIDKNISLCFAVSINDPFFLNFTDLPIDKSSEEIYYLSNLNNNKIDSQLLLSANSSSEYVSTSDTIKLCSQKFTYSGSSSNPSVLIEVKDINDETVISQNATVQSGSYSVLIDLTAYQPAHFKLYVDGLEELIFYSDSSLTGQNIFAIAEIFISDSVPDEYKLIDIDKNISYKNYLVKFCRRKTYWKYNVVMKYRTSIDPADIEITHPDSSIEFSQLPSQVLSDGDTAVPFVSNKVIDLTESTVEGIVLKSNNGSSSNQINLENLPNASVRNSVPDSLSDKVYSEIFIYI